MDKLNLNETILSIKEFYKSDLVKLTYDETFLKQFGYSKERLEFSATRNSQLVEWLEELKAYRDAEKQGLLPKFHLGDEFWTVRCREVLKSKIVMLQQKKDGTWRYRFSQEISSKYHDTSDYEEKDYGKYFFDVKEEAEKLAEKEKKQWEEELKRLEEKRKKSTETKGE